MNKEHKSIFKCYALEFILVIATAIIVGIEKRFFFDLFYKAGLAGQAVSIANGLKDCCLLVLLLVLSCIALFGLIKTIYMACKTKEINWLKIFLLIVPLVMTPITISKKFSKPGAIDFLRGYEKWVQKELDVNSIQKLVELLNTDSSWKEYSKVTHTWPGLPEEITKLNREYIYFSDYGVEKRYIEFKWGGPFDCWGVRIGLPGMATPDEGYIIIKKDEYEFRRLIQPGIYIFIRG